MAEELRIYQAIDQGQPFTPLNQQELERWRQKPFNVLVDLVHNLIHVRLLRDESHFIRVDEHPLGTPVILEFIRVIAEHPGQNITRRIYGRYTDHDPEPNTFTRIAFRGRRLLGDRIGKNGLIMDRIVDPSINETGHAYCGNPAFRWIVIRYIDDLSARAPSHHPPI